MRDQACCVGGQAELDAEAVAQRRGGVVLDIGAHAVFALDVGEEPGTVRGDGPPHSRDDRRRVSGVVQDVVCNDQAKGAELLPVGPRTRSGSGS